jgi:hypothetical protein
MPASSDFKKAQHSAQKAAEKSSVTVTTSSEKQVESVNMDSHAGNSSLYTEEEIKERRQAWNRIPMPLDPHKSKRLGITVVSGQPPVPQIRNKSSGNTTEETGVFIPFIGEKVQLEPSDMVDMSSTKPEQSAEKARVSVKDEIQQPVEDELLNSEQKSEVATQLPLASSKTECLTNTMTKEDPCSSKMNVYNPCQTTPEQSVRETTASEASAPTNENKANNVATNQNKPKSKANKNKKTKKRLGSAPQSVLRKEGSSQEISPSVSETSAILSKGEPRIDHHVLMSTPAMPESLSVPVYYTGKLEESAAEPCKDSREQAAADVRSQYNYDTLPRGRLDFRNNAGGSLKIPKKRKNKYSTITSKTFEAPTAGRFEPSQPGYATGDQMSIRNPDGACISDSITHVAEPDHSKRSRLNPLATAFESPRKAAAATAAPMVDVGTIPNPDRAASFQIGPGDQPLRENRPSSRFKVMQRSATAHNSPTKAPQPKERFVRRVDGAKVADGFQISTRQQENNPAEVQRGWSRDKHRYEGESKEPANSKGISPGKKAALDKEDWPSLPAFRVRSATLQ